MLSAVNATVIFAECRYTQRRKAECRGGKKWRGYALSRNGAEQKKKRKES